MPEKPKKKKSAKAEPENHVHCSFDRMVKIGEVKPNPRNPNKHPPAQIQLLAKIIATQGWRTPISVSNQSGLIVRGHGRYEAAKTLGLSEVPIDFQDYESEESEWADLIADNRLAELAEMDFGSLATMLKEMNMDAFDMDLTGYAHGELEQILSWAETQDTEDDPKKLKIPDAKHTFNVLVTCKDEDEQQSMLAKFLEEGLEAKPIIL